MAGNIFARKWPAPVLKPGWPFLVSSLIVLYGVNALADRMMDTDEFRNDPRNPKFKAKNVEQK